MTLTYHEHKHYKYLFDGLACYINQEYPNNEDGSQYIPEAITRYYDYLKCRFDEHPLPLSAYFANSDILYDSEDCRYPSEDFLISLCEADAFMIHDSLDGILNLIMAAWYKFGDDDNDSDMAYIDKEGWHVFYTGGWSGNEDILSAFLGNLLFIAYFDYMFPNPAVCKIRRR